MTAVAPISWLAPGEYAGRARYSPCDRTKVTPELRPVVGQVVEVKFAGIAARGQPVYGQALYVEWRQDKYLGGRSIPSQDLEFLD